MLADRLGIPGGRVDARADGRGAHVDLADQRLRLAQPVNVLGDGVAERGELLAERHRNGVLQLRSAHFHQLPELLPFGEERRDELAHYLAQSVDAGVQRELHRRGVDVVGALRPVDVVVGVAVIVVPTRMAEQFERAIGDDLVGVHVGRRARTALDHVDEKVLVMPAVLHLARGANDGISDRGFEQAEVAIGEGRRLLHLGERDDERGKLPQRDAGDGEVLERAQRLDAVERCRGHVAVAQQVVLRPRGAAEEPGGASVPDERGAGHVEPLGDGPRRLREERGVQLRHVLQQRGERLLAEQHHLGLLECQAGGAVVRVVEQDPLADHLADAQRGEARDDAALRLVDGDGAREDDSEERTSVTLGEQRVALGERCPGAGRRELLEQGIGEAGEEGDGLQIVLNGHGSGPD